MITIRWTQFSGPRINIFMMGSQSDCQPKLSTTLKRRHSRIFSTNKLGVASTDVLVWVVDARQRQWERFAGTDIASNADMRPAQIQKYCGLDEACQNLMKTAMRQLQLTARAYHRVLKQARTIADLAGSEDITQVHLAEALQYRPKLDLM